MSEFRFKIDAYTPETLPMEDLAEYLAHLAQMLGTPSAVHFVRLDKGSVIPVIKIETEALPKVRERVRAVASGIGPTDAIRAYQAINNKLKSDNGSGGLIDVEQQGAEIIRFPGAKEEPAETFGSVRKHGTLDGEVIRVGGQNRAKVPITLQIEDRIISYIHAKKAVAEEMRLYRPVRLYGMGRWRRDPIGFWNLEDFSVDRFEALKEDKLSSAINSIRSVAAGDWVSGAALQELRDLRDEPDTD